LPYVEVREFYVNVVCMKGNIKREGNPLPEDLEAEEMLYMRSNL